MRSISEIDAEIRALGGDPDDYSQGNNVQAPQRSIEDIDAEIAKLEAAQPKQGFMHRLGQGARGFLSSIGASHDMLPHGGAKMALMDIPAMPEQNERIAEAKRLYPASKLLPESLGFGEKFVPSEDDTLGKVVHGAGEFAAPSPFLPIGGYGSLLKAGAQGFKPLAKAAAREALTGVGMSAGMHATPRIAEEGSGLGAAEDLAKGILGSRVANAIPGAIKGLPKAHHALMTVGAEPNAKVFELAKKHDIELPSNVGLHAPIPSFYANVAGKSIFSPKVYRDMWTKAGDSMLSAVKRSIDSLGDSSLTPHEVSGEMRRHLQVEEKAAENHASKLYDKASSYLTPGESVKPVNTLKVIDNLEEMLKRPVKSAPTKKVAHVVKQIGDAFNITKNLGITEKMLEEDPEMVNVILNTLKKQGKNIPDIPVETLIGIRKELGSMTNYDPTIKGTEAHLNGMIKALNKDIKSTSNKEFLSRWTEANQFFKDDVAKRFRTDMARSLLANEAPAESFNLMNSAQNVKQMAKIAGENPKSMEVFNALKKAKVRDIFANALKDDSVGLAPFTNVFNKKESTGDLLKTLVGDAEFKKLSEISEIADEFRSSGKELLNTSGTAIASSDLAKLGKLGAFMKDNLAVILGGTASYVDPTSALGSIAATNLTGRLLANQAFINNARAYAIARQAGREKQAQGLLNRLIRISEPEARAVLNQLEKEQQEAKD